jgi:opacity protein-like surface antigen
VIPIRRTKSDREVPIGAPIQGGSRAGDGADPRGAAAMIRKILVLGTLLAASLGQAARAADLDVPPPVNVPQDDMSSLFGSGWYIRGDIGYSVPQGPSGSFDNVPLTQVSWANSATAGIGVGYKITNWFRADVTGDYLFQRDVHYFGTDPRSNNGLFRNSTELGGYTVLANGYFDIGTWSGVTPYVGAGAGYAFWRNGNIKNVPIAQTPGVGFMPYFDPTTGSPIVRYRIGGSRGSFAWALMAGASVDLGLGLKFDLGYRYLNIADGDLVANGATVATKLKSLGVNQFRIGLRYAFDQ